MERPSEEMMTNPDLPAFSKENYALFLFQSLSDEQKQDALAFIRSLPSYRASQPA